MPFAPVDLLLTLAPASLLLALSWALRRLSAAAPGIESTGAAAGSQPVAEPERHGELVPAYAPADA